MCVVRVTILFVLSIFFVELPFHQGDRPGSNVNVTQKSYVFEKGGKLKYHLTKDCECLQQDYVNFHIPKDITDLGDNVVEEFRAWFKSKGYAQKYFNGTLNNSKVVFDFNMIFPSKYNITPLLPANLCAIDKLIVVDIGVLKYDVNFLNNMYLSNPV